MPVTYEYRCGCEHTTILRVPVEQRDEERTCFTCKESLTRIYSAPGLSFKGEGWGAQS